MTYPDGTETVSDGFVGLLFQARIPLVWVRWGESGVPGNGEGYRVPSWVAVILFAFDANRRRSGRLVVKLIRRAVWKPTLQSAILVATANRAEGQSPVGFDVLLALAGLKLNGRKRKATM